MRARSNPAVGLAVCLPVLLAGGCALTVSSTPFTVTSHHQPVYQWGQSVSGDRITIEFIARDPLPRSDLRDYAFYYAAKTALEAGYARFFVVQESYDEVPKILSAASILPVSAPAAGTPPPQSPRIRLEVECLHRNEYRIFGPRILLTDAATAKSQLGYRLHLFD